MQFNSCLHQQWIVAGLYCCHNVPIHWDRKNYSVSALWDLHVLKTHLFSILQNQFKIWNGRAFLHGNACSSALQSNKSNSYLKNRKLLPLLLNRKGNIGIIDNRNTWTFSSILSFLGEADTRSFCSYTHKQIIINLMWLLQKYKKAKEIFLLVILLAIWHTYLRGN